METNHTKGQWTVGKTSNFEYMDIDCNGQRITSVYTGIESNPEAEANAKLIAAAPELLEALVRILEDDAENGILSPVDRVIAKTAIEKATI